MVKIIKVNYQRILTLSFEIEPLGSFPVMLPKLSTEFMQK